MAQKIFHIFRDESNNYWCALCLMSLGANLTYVELHVDQKKHKSRLIRNRNANQLAENYHTFWSRHDSDIRAQKVYFYPLRPNKIFCLLCQYVLAHKSFFEHIQSDVHVDRLETIATKGTYCWLDVEPKKKPKTPKQNPAELASPKKPNVEHKADTKTKSVSDPPPAVAVKRKPKKGPRKNDKVLLQYVYECVPCKFLTITKLLWRTHLFHAKHLEKCQPLKAFREHECATCAPGRIFDDDTMSNHIHFTEFRQHFSSACILAMDRTMMRILSTAKRLSLFIEDLTIDSKLNYQPKVVAKCCADLKETLSPVFPQCKVYPFGSRVSQLGIGHSDLDVFVDVHNNYRGMENLDCEMFVKIAASVLRKHRFLWGRCVAIPHARTPIVQIFHRSNKIQCDISFTNGLGVENTKLIQHFVKLQPIVKKMVLFFKQWVDFNGLFYNIKSYSLTLMTVFYLQHVKLLPSLTELRKRENVEPLIIAYWDCSFPSKPTSIPLCQLPLPKIMENMFKFYGNFDFEKNVISVFLGQTIEKTNFVTVENLPPEMKRYVDNVETKKALPILLKYPMAVQDPFDLSHNTTKNVSFKCLLNFKRACQLSATLLMLNEQKYRMEF